MMDYMLNEGKKALVAGEIFYFVRIKKGGCQQTISPAFANTTNTFTSSNLLN